MCILCFCFLVVYIIRSARELTVSTLSIVELLNDYAWEEEAAMEDVSLKARVTAKLKKSVAGSTSAQLNKQSPSGCVTRSVWMSCAVH